MGDGHGHLLIVWNEPHMTGVNILDEQHRAFAAMVNSLHYSLMVRQDPDHLHPIYNMVMGFAKTHFPTEIEMLKESGYPQVNAHQTHHDRFITDSMRIYEYSSEKDGDPKAYLEFLKRWWKFHILHEDLAFSAHLQTYLRSERRIIKKR
ncbi:MAG: hemerythrin family protein [Planctomycetes bacterium]|nr:hemerythrin family protein [Planctomycetota bacterium]